MLDSLCIIFMTGYFEYSNGTYNPVPESTTRIEIKTEEFRTLLFKIDDKRWFGNMDGKIFFSSLDNYTELLCKMAEKEKLPENAYEKRAILLSP